MLCVFWAVSKKYLKGGVLNEDDVLFLIPSLPENDVWWLLLMSGRDTQGSHEHALSHYLQNLT